MEDKNMNETPAKENIFLKILKMFGTYLKHLAYDFITSFKYNNMKLAAILVAVPGVIFGFFLAFHARTINGLGYSYEILDEETFMKVTKNYPGMPFDYTGVAVFALMIIGVLNLFMAVSMSGKKNLTSVVLATILTALFIIISAAYIYAIFYYKSLLHNDNIIVNGEKVTGINKDWEWTTDIVMSLISVFVSAICSVAGVVLGYINYDRTYEKVDR